MSKQPEALSDILSSVEKMKMLMSSGYAKPDRDMRAMLTLVDEIDRLHELNAELLHALQRLFNGCNPEIKGNPGSALEEARATIAKAAGAAS